MSIKCTINVEPFQELPNTKRRVILEIDKLVIVQEHQLISVNDPDKHYKVTNYLTAVTKKGTQYPLFEVDYPFHIQLTENAK